MRPAEIERHVRAHGDVSVIERTHHHRAWCENAWGRVRGRDRLIEQRVAALATDGIANIAIDAEGDQMVAFTSAAGWRGHRWVQHESDRIIGEIEIIDDVARVVSGGSDPNLAAQLLGAAAPMHAPLGELRAGRGQLATEAEPAFGETVPANTYGAALWAHRLWNARAIDTAAAQWRGPADAGSDGKTFILSILTTLPDAVWLIERAGMLDDGRIALLWRLHGHHLGTGLGDPSGRRVRLIGSSVLTMDGDRVVAEDMLIDTLALAATPYRPIIDYAGFA